MCRSKEKARLHIFYYIFCLSMEAEFINFFRQFLEKCPELAEMNFLKINIELTCVK